MKILVIGSGGREHALGWKIKQSSRCSELFFAPGNGGTSSLGTNVDIKADDIDGLVKFAKENNIGLTMAGPEIPLVLGVVDAFEAQGMRIFGPVRAGAMLEGSKVFCKEVMRCAGVPTADFEVFDDIDLAHAYIDRKGMPIVVKADGPAAGKGVVVAGKPEYAYDAAYDMLENRVFGAAGEKIVIEECLSGQEASIIAFMDRDTVLPLVVSQDHKRIYDNDQGPNTGGMGAYAPAPLVTDKMLERIKNEVFEPMRIEMQKRGVVFRGILYAGLMIDGEDINVLEFNVRFGDPETQVIIPKLKTDLVELMEKTIDDDLKSVQLEFDNRACITVVMASAGYPAYSDKGRVISGIVEAQNSGAVLFHAGTAWQNGNLVTDGGRVLAVTALGETLAGAKESAYAAVEKIVFEGMQYRSDIGAKAL